MAKNEAKIKFTAETGEFNKSISQAQSELKELGAELKLNETQMKSTGSSVEALEKKHDLLEKQLKASESKTEALAQKVQKAAEIYGENSKEVANLKVQLTNAQTAEEKVRQAISKCNKEIDDQIAANKENESATSQLTSKMNKQQSELNQLKKRYSDLALEGRKTSDEAQELAREIKQLSNELNDSKRAFKDAANAADKLDKSLDGTSDGFTVAKGAMADLASNAIQGAIGKVKEFIGYLKELPEATREFRQQVTVLETSFESAGFGAEVATETTKELYSVFGDEDRAVEAASLIAKMAKNEEDLAEWTNIATGIFGSYGDSLPVEGLAEASNETVKTGQVTGTLADALNWSSEAASMFSKYMSEDVTTAEDAFNVALSKCTTEQERQALITDTLTALYGDAADTYRETAGAQMEAKEVAYETMQAEADLGEAIEPVTTTWQGMKNELLVGFMPVIEEVCGWLTDTLAWLKEHPAILKGVAIALGVVATALGVMAIATAVQTAAQWAQNAAWLAFPGTWIIMAVVAAIALLIVIIAVVVEYWDVIKQAFINAWNWIRNICSTIGDWINTNVIQPVVKFFTGLWASIKNIWNNIVNAVKVAIMFIGSIISAAWNIITLPFRFIWENCKKAVFTAFEWIKQKISAAVQAIKNIFSTIKNFFANIWNSVKKVFAPVAQWFREKFTAAKTAVTNAWSSVKNFFSNIWSGIKSTFSNVGSWFKDKFTAAKNGISTAWSSVTKFFSNIKNKVVKTFSDIKEKLSKPFKAAIDKIKGFFDKLKLKFPDIKLPHFSISGKFSLDPPSVPKLKIDWYSKAMNNPMILNGATIFGQANGRFLGGGEVGSEMIGGTNTIMSMIQNAVDRSIRSDNINQLVKAVEDLANRPIEIGIDGRQFAIATASATDSVGGLRNTFKSRGLILD